MKEINIYTVKEPDETFKVKDWTYLQHNTQHKIKIINDDGNVEQIWLVTRCMNILTIGLFYRDFLQMHSREFPGKRASNSEVRRWINNGSIKINNEQLRNINDIVEFPVVQLSFFSKKAGRITLI